MLLLLPINYVILVPYATAKTNNNLPCNITQVARSKPFAKSPLLRAITQVQRAQPGTNVDTPLLRAITQRRGHDLKHTRNLFYSCYNTTQSVRGITNAKSPLLRAITQMQEA